MGRPLSNRLFGAETGSGNQLHITSCWIPTEGSANSTSYIVKQLGTNLFVAKNLVTGVSGNVSLVQTVSAAGQAKINVSPFATGSGATFTVKMKVTGVTIVNSGTSGYAVNDTITITGGTSTTTAVLTVSSVSSGKVTGLTITTPGAYSVLPANPVSTTTSGSGTGFTATLVWGVQAVAVSAGGSGYTSVVLATSGGAGSGAVVTGAITTGAVSSATVVESGTGWTTIPSVVATATGTVQTLKKISSCRVSTFEGNTYFWHADGTAPDATYAVLPMA